MNMAFIDMGVCLLSKLLPQKGDATVEDQGEEQEGLDSNGGLWGLVMSILGLERKINRLGS